MGNRETGACGEKKAAEYLRKRGYKIIEKNYYCRFGEIDIIAEKKDYLVFVEVKTRAQEGFGGGVGAVDAAKRRRIVKAAQSYLMNKDQNINVRFDVVELTDGKINHIEDAFYN